MGIVGFFLTFLMKEMVYSMPQKHHAFYNFIATIFITIIIWEGNLQIDHWLNKKFPWVQFPFKRVALQFLIALLYTGIALFLLIMGYDAIICCDQMGHQKLMWNSFILGMVVSALLLTIEISTQFFQGWKSSLIEVEKYKAQHAQAELRNLKEQINPHFLFNNLSVLSSLVYKDADKAVDFIKQMSNVYRYALDSRKEELITLQEELEFLNAYNHLLSIRFEGSLSFEVHINKQDLFCYLPPMCLQILVENAIQHNELSAAHPLYIRIESTENTIQISNPIRPRMHTQKGTGTGLQNIQSRYAFFSNEKVLIKNDGQIFMVQLPLLQINQSTTNTHA